MVRILSSISIHLNTVLSLSVYSRRNPFNWWLIYLQAFPLITGAITILVTILLYKVFKAKQVHKDDEEEEEVEQQEEQQAENRYFKYL